MKSLAALVLSCAPALAQACGGAICLVDPNSLILTQIITFDDQSSGAGPGRHIDATLPLPSATFGERFAGQTVIPEGVHDTVHGQAAAPLTVLPGLGGQNLSLVRFYGNTILNGYGTAGFPKRHAQGEGAIAILFDTDQSALAFDLRGGEAGAAFADFYRRDGSLIGTLSIEPTGEFPVAFLRSTGQADIAGLVLTNTDPQGLAIDTLRFGKPPELG